MVRHQRKAVFWSTFQDSSGSLKGTKIRVSLSVTKLSQEERKRKRKMGKLTQSTIPSEISYGRRGRSCRNWSEVLILQSGLRQGKEAQDRACEVPTERTLSILSFSTRRNDDTRQRSLTRLS